MASKVANNAFGTLGTGITALVTTITLGSGQGARFPALSAGDWFWGTLTNVTNNIEIVKVTAVTGDVLTVLRGQDGTTARAYILGDKFEQRPTAALFNDKADVVALASYATTSAVATSYAPLAAPTFTGPVTLNLTRFAVTALGTITGTNTLDLSAAAEFTATLTATAVTFAFSNAPAAGRSQVVYLRLTNAGLCTITWPTLTKFAGGTLGTLTSAGTDLLGVKYDSTTSTYMVFAIGKAIA